MFPRFEVAFSAPPYGSSSAWNPQKWGGSGPVVPSMVGGPAVNAILRAPPSHAILGGPARSAILRGGTVDISA